MFLTLRGDVVMSENVDDGDVGGSTAGWNIGVSIVIL